MTTWQDAQIGLKKETTYGTAVTVDRFLDFITHSLDYSKGIVQSQALRGGKVRSTTRCTYTENAGGGIELEAMTKGQGTFWEMVMGAGTSTKVPTATKPYQQLFTLGDTMPSYTIQAGIPRPAASTVDPFTYTGAVCSQFTVNFENADLLKVNATVDGRDVSTATALASATYPAGEVFCFKGASIYSGAIAVPTATALGSGATELTSVQSGSFTVNHNLQSSRPLGSGGLKGQPTPGVREITGTLNIEYDSTTWTAALLGDTSLGLVVTYEGSLIEAGYYNTIQFVIPAVKLDGELPKPNGGEIINQTVNFTGLWDGTNEPIYVAIRTEDTAL